MKPKDLEGALQDVALRLIKLAGYQACRSQGPNTNANRTWEEGWDAGYRSATSAAVHELKADHFDYLLTAHPGYAQHAMPEGT